MRQIQCSEAESNLAGEQGCYLGACDGLGEGAVQAEGDGPGRGSFSSGPYGVKRTHREPRWWFKGASSG